MNRGDVWWVDFAGSIGGEPRKARPCIIISTDMNNARLNRLQVVPLTSNVSRQYPWEAIVVVNGRPLKALANSITTVARSRVSNRVGAVARGELQSVEAALKLQLGL